MRGVGDGGGDRVRGVGGGGGVMECESQSNVEGAGVPVQFELPQAVQQEEEQSKKVNRKTT